MFAEIRAACAQVAKTATFVRLEQEALRPYAQSLDVKALKAPVYDTTHHYTGEVEDVLAYTLILDAINFGSGYFPTLKKRAGMSGYFTVASSLKDYCNARGVPSARALTNLTSLEVAAIFGQDLTQPGPAELMRLFTEALQQLGSFTLERFRGSYVALVEAAGGSAERLAESLAQMPYFDDVSSYQGRRVPLYKRAQIVASDLALAFEGQGWGAFDDLDDLTTFADNLVPHVLRVDGLLRYDPGLLARIEAGQLLPHGSPEEIEIRAVALYSVEWLAAQLEGVTPRVLDVYLWNRGQARAYKDAPRHRSRCVFY